MITDTLLLAAQQPKGPEFGKASPLGLLVILLLLVGTVLLIRSMNTQLRKLPRTFDASHPEPDQEFDEGTDSGAAVQTSPTAADETAAAGTADGRSVETMRHGPTAADGDHTAGEQRPTGA